MKTLLFSLLVMLSFFSIQAQQNPDSAQHTYGFSLRYRPLVISNGLGLGYYLHPNHSIEVYGTLQATFDLWEPETLWERSVIVEYRYYAINRRKARWFIAPFFKHGHSRFLYANNPMNLGYTDFWRKDYVKDNSLGAILGFQFNVRPRKRGKSYAEIFAGPQFMFRQYHEHYISTDSGLSSHRIVNASGGGFVRFGVNFCYDFYRKNR